MGRYALWACTALLAFRAITGFVNVRPVFFLAFAAALTVTLSTFVARPKRSPALAGRILGRARNHMAHYAPEYRPAYRTYAELALPAAVALFGIAVVETARRVARGRRWRVGTRVDLGARSALVLGSPRRIRAVRLGSLNWAP